MCLLMDIMERDYEGKGREEGREEYRKTYKMLKRGACTSIDELVEVGVNLKTATAAYEDFFEDF